MRIGVFSDTHANIEALQAVQKALDDDKVDQRVCLGHGYGPGARRSAYIWSTWRTSMVPP